MVCLYHRRVGCGFYDPGGPPETAEEACQKFRERHLKFPRFRNTNEDERVAIERELALVWTFPAPWDGSKAKWKRLHKILRDAIARTHERTPPNSSSEDEPDFDDQSEYLSPAWDPSHQPALSGRADRAGGYANYMPSHHASHIESSDGEATPPPPYSGYPYSGAHNARRHEEVHEAPGHPGGYNTGGYNTEGFREEHGNSRHHGGRNNGGLREEHGNSRHPGGYNTGGFREDHGNSRHHGGRNSGGFREEHSNFRHHRGRNNGGFREDHGNSRRQGSLNAPHSHGGSLEPDTFSDSGAEASLSASESHHNYASNEDLRYMDRVGIPEGRRTDWVRTRDTVLQNQMRQQPNPSPSGRRRRRGGWRD